MVSLTRPVVCCPVLRQTGCGVAVPLPQAAITRQWLSQSPDSPAGPEGYAVTPFLPADFMAVPGTACHCLTYKPGWETPDQVPSPHPHVLFPHCAWYHQQALLIHKAKCLG